MTEDKLIDYIVSKLDNQEKLLIELKSKVEKIEMKFYIFTALCSVVGGALMQAYFAKLLG